MLLCDAAVYVARVLPIAAGHPEGWTNYTKSLCNFSQREKCYLLCQQTISPPKMFLHSLEFHLEEN